MIRKAKRMARVAGKQAECESKHPKAWRLGIELADGLFDSRSEYLIEETKTEEGAREYIRLATENILVSLGDGSLVQEQGIVFPEPVTDSSAACFGIAITKRLFDRFDQALEGR